MPDDPESPTCQDGNLWAVHRVGFRGQSGFALLIAYDSPAYVPVDRRKSCRHPIQVLSRSDQGSRERAVGGIPGEAGADAGRGAAGPTPLPPMSKSLRPEGVASASASFSAKLATAIENAPRGSTIYASEREPDEACRFCGTPLVLSPGARRWKCVNPSCPGGSDWPRRLYHVYGAGSFMGKVKRHWTKDCRYLKRGGMSIVDESESKPVSPNERCSGCWPEKYRFKSGLWQRKPETVVQMPAPMTPDKNMLYVRTWKDPESVWKVAGVTQTGSWLGYPRNGQNVWETFESQYDFIEPMDIRG